MAARNDYENFSARKDAVGGVCGLSRVRQTALPLRKNVIPRYRSSGGTSAGKEEGTVFQISIIVVARAPFESRLAISISK